MTEDGEVLQLLSTEHNPPRCAGGMAASVQEAHATGLCECSSALLQCYVQIFVVEEPILEAEMTLPQVLVDPGSQAALLYVQFAIIIMVAGAVIAGATDLTYNVQGYVWVAICAVSTAVYLLLIRLLKDKTGAPSASSWSMATSSALLQQVCMQV